MNHQPSSANDANILTFRSEEANESRVIDVAALTEADISALRTNDPFMYYSIIKPTGNHRNKPKMAQHGGNEGPEADRMVARQTRISMECDAVTVLMQMLEGGDDTTIRNHRNEPEMAQHGGNEGPEADGMVARQTRISVECDVVTVLMQMLEGGDDATIDDDGRDEDIRELAMLFEQ